MGYDATKLKTPEECRIVMQRAQERKVPEVYNAVFKRLCDLTGIANDDPSDPLVADFYKTLAAMSNCLRKKINAIRLHREPDRKLQTKAFTRA